ncbi:MAG: flagellar hook-length control protein FliK [Bacillota bacterium]
MLTQNFIVDFLAKPVKQPNEVPKRAGLDKGSFPQFKETLNSAIDKTYSKENRRSFLAEGKNRAQSDEGVRQGSKIRSFKDAVRINEEKKVQKEESIKLQDSSDNAIDKIQKKDNKVDVKETKVKDRVMEESLAKVLGISTEELKSILASLNIQPGDLTDELKVEEIAKKISGFLGLGPDEERTLSEIISITQKEVESSIENFKENSKENFKTAFQNAKSAAKNEDTKDWVKLQGVDVEVAVKEAPGKKELGLKISTVLNELTHKLIKEPDSVISQVTETAQKVLADNIETMDDYNTETTGAADISEEEILNVKNDSVKEKGDKTAFQDNTSGEEKSDNERKQPEKLESLTASKVETSELKPGENKDTQFSSVLNASDKRVTQTGETVQVEKQIPVTKKEIVAQVVEKAKVVISGDKSEMVMDLKPDHLGKLALKVVTERGIVIAKFVAESEQVKAALEANMDTLKESLEKQGFSIQGFSVSVGQDKDRGYNRNSHLSGEINKSGAKDKVLASGTVNTVNLEEVHKRVNPYNAGDSSIDITA